MSRRSVKTDLDHQVWKLVKQNGLHDQRILIALSGGVDSVALLRVLSKIHHPEKIAAAYFHHGMDSNQEYRDQAQIFCADLCAHLSVPFFPLRAQATATSESAYREMRYQSLRELMNGQCFSVLATGHHSDDLLETRLLRLIRGAGAQGLVAMRDVKDDLFRPFLRVTKKELRQYVEDEGLSFCEDPSNQSLDPLRNWMREDWLPSLEARAPGATSVMARSLEIIVEELQDRAWGDLLAFNASFESQGLARSFYLTLPPSEQKRLIAQYLYALGKKDFSQSHLQEIQKRLDNSQKVITFTICGCKWEINAEQIKVQS